MLLLVNWRINTHIRANSNMPGLASWVESTRPPDLAPLQIRPVPDSAVAEADEGISRGKPIVSQVVRKVKEPRYSYNFTQYSEAKEATGSTPEPQIQEHPPVT